MSLKTLPPVETCVVKRRPAALSLRGFERMKEILAGFSARIHSALHPQDPSRRMQFEISSADKAIEKEVRSVKGGFEAFLGKIGNVPWMRPLLHMVAEGQNELKLGRSILAVDLKGYSTLLAEGKIPPDILIQFMGRFYAGVAKIAAPEGGLLFRTPMGDCIEFAFDDPKSAQLAEQEVKSFMRNDFFDDEWKKRLSHFGVAEDSAFEANTDARPNTCVAINLFRLSPRRILPVYSKKAVKDISPVRTDNLGFAKDIKTAVAAAQLCPMPPAAMMAERPDIAKEYKFVAGSQFIYEGQPLFTSAQTEIKSALARDVLQECSARPSVQVFKTGEKGELVFISGDPAELLQFIWRISEVCRASGVQFRAGLFGGVFHSREVYKEVQSGWSDLHGTPYAKAIRAANFEGSNDIMAGQEVIDEIRMGGGSIVKPYLTSFRNMGSYSVFRVLNVDGPIKLRKAPEENIEQLKRRLAETGPGGIPFEGNLKAAYRALKRKGYKSVYVQCSPRIDIAQKIVGQLITFLPVFAPNRDDIERIKKSPRSLIDFLEAHGIRIEIFLDRADKLAPHSLIFANKLLELTSGTNLVQIVYRGSSAEARANSLAHIRAFAGAAKPATEEDLVAQKAYDSFIKQNGISEQEEELIILFFLAGEALDEEDLRYYFQERIDVLETARELTGKGIFKFERTEKKWSLAADPELLEGCQVQKIHLVRQFNEAIGNRQYRMARERAGPEEKKRLLGHALEHLAAADVSDVFILTSMIDEVIQLCDGMRDYRLAFEYVERKLELLQRPAAAKTPQDLLGSKTALTERFTRALNLNYREAHLDSLRRLLTGETEQLLSPPEKMRLRMYFLAALVSAEGREAQEEFDKTRKELFSLPFLKSGDASSDITAQFQCLAARISQYKEPPNGKTVQEQEPEFFESLAESFTALCKQYGDSFDPYAAVTAAKYMAACVSYYCQRGGRFSKAETWLHFTEDFWNRHKERFIETEKLTGEIGKFLHNLARLHVEMARERRQMNRPDVAENVLKHIHNLRRYAEENADEEMLGRSLHLEASYLIEQDKYAEAWEINKKLLAVDMEPARAIHLYVNSAEILYKMRGTPTGDLVLARYYLGRAHRLLVESKMNPALATPKFLTEFKKWDGPIAEELSEKTKTPVLPLLAA